MYNIHHKYNFIIQPVENYDIVDIDGESGSDVDFAYPEKLNFTYEKSLTVIYKMGVSVDRIKLNPDASYITCDPYPPLIKCTIPVEHFDNKLTGYYNTYHLNR